MNAADVAGYQYQADVYHVGCIVEVLIREGEAGPAARDMEVEEVLDQIAEANGIDRSDEASFDSGDFPKVVSWDGLDHEEGESCGWCFEWVSEPAAQDQEDGVEEVDEEQVTRDLESLRQAVAAGSALLSKAREKWACEIDLGSLDLSNPRLCVLGQVYGDKAVFGGSGYMAATEYGWLAIEAGIWDGDPTVYYKESLSVDLVAAPNPDELGFNAPETVMGDDWAFERLDELWAEEIERVRAGMDCGEGAGEDGE